MPQLPTMATMRLTAAELSMALGLTRTDATTATPNNTADDTLSTSDFAGFLSKLAMLEDIIDAADENTTDTGPKIYRRRSTHL